MNKLYISQYELNSHVQKLCRDITIDKWYPDYVIGIVRGGAIPAVMISHYFDVPCEMLKISLRGDTPDTESNCWMAEDALAGKKILVVDDINDSGATLEWLMSDWESSAPASVWNDWSEVWNFNVRFATIVDNLSSELGCAIDYTALSVNKAEEDVWVVFPWEF